MAFKMDFNHPSCSKNLSENEISNFPTSNDSEVDECCKIINIKQPGTARQLHFKNMQDNRYQKQF